METRKNHTFHPENKEKVKNRFWFDWELVEDTGGWKVEDD
jgi:hypothetical protein